MPGIGKIVIALIVASATSGIALSPAFAEGNDKRDEHQDKDRHKAESHDDRNRHDHPQPNYFYYSQPIYVPPAVYYAPSQSPGISLVLPLDIHIR